MSKRRKVQFATLLTWVVATALYGWWYVQSQLALPGLEGYETWRTAQVWFFALTRLPFCIILLVFLLWWEQRAFKPSE